MVRDGIMNAVWCNGKRTEKSFNLNYKLLLLLMLLQITKLLRNKPSFKTHERKVIKNSQHRFSKDKSSLSSTFIWLVQWTVSILIDFSMSFLTISDIILTVKLEKYTLNRRTPQKMEIGVGSGWRSKVSCYLNYSLNLWSNLFFSNCTASINSYPVLPIKLFSW